MTYMCGTLIELAYKWNHSTVKIKLYIYMINELIYQL